MRKMVIAYFKSTYTVLSIEGSTKYTPGQALSKKQVETLCSTKSWEIKIVTGGPSSLQFRLLG